VANRAVVDANKDLRRIVEIGRSLDHRGLRLDGARARRFEKPGGKAPVRRRGRDVVHAGADHGGAAKDHRSAVISREANAVRMATRLKPDPDTERQTDVAGALARPSRKIGGLPEFP